LSFGQHFMKIPKINLKSLFKNKKKFVVLAMMLIIVGFGVFKLIGNKEAKPQYQTATAEKGMLVISISGSGTISSGNSTKITTKASGTIKNVYVQNGDIVTKGQKIADLNLDDYALSRQSTAYVAYLDAVEAVKTAEKSKTDADIAMWTARQAIFDSQKEQEDMRNGEANPDTGEDYTESERAVVDKAIEQAHQAFTVAELKYKNADADITNARIKVTAAWQDYQEVSANIVAPTGGTISSLTLAPGTVIESTTSTNANSTSNASSNATVTAQQIGVIYNTDGQFKATLNLTESDIVSVKAGQKATLTLDAFPDKTFTGQVLAVDATGSVSSGVTSYPVTILLDQTNENIFPNMAVDATIITETIDNVVLVPTAAVVMANGESIVRILNDDQMNTVSVTTAGSNDSQTAISSGLEDGQTIVTSITSTTNTNANTSSTTSVFGTGFGSGGGNRMIMGSPPGGR